MAASRCRPRRAWASTSTSPRSRNTGYATERRATHSNQRRCQMRKAIIDRQVKAMAENGLDAMVSCSPENYAYATGFVVPSQPLIRHRHAMAIVTADAKTELFSVDMEASTVKRRAPNVPTRIWAEF